MPNNINTTVDAILSAIIAEEGRMPPKKKLAVKAAVLCFAEFGYDGTSTRMIADKAGVAEATIFRHYGTKNGLLMGIVTPVVKHLLAPAAKNQALALRANHDDVREFFRAIMLSRLRFADKYAPLVRIFLQEYLVNEGLRGMLRTQLGGFLSSFAVDLIGDCQKSGQIKPVPPERVLRWSMSLLAGYYMNRSILAPGDWDDEAEVEAMADFLMNGIGL